MKVVAHRRGVHRAALWLAIAVVAGTAACSSASSTPSISKRFQPAAAAPLPNTTPYLLMTSAGVGLAVWPSGSEWLLLSTADGWRHIANRTPLAVPTGGGLVVTRSAAIDVAIGAFDRLTQSPFLTAATIGADWTPAELPGAVRAARGAVGETTGRAYVVLNGKNPTLVSGGPRQWTSSLTATTLTPQGGFRLDAVTWADANLGWLTGHGRSGVPMAFQTNDGGQSWHALSTTSGSSVATLAPCGAGTNWLLPVISSDGTIRVRRTADGGQTWTAGQPIGLAAGLPAWACQGSQVLMAGRAGKAEHVFASADGGATWQDSGVAPAGLSDLAITGDGVGFATSTTGHGATLWAVGSRGATFSPLPLPAWVKTIGAEMGQS